VALFDAKRLEGFIPNADAQAAGAREHRESGRAVRVGNARRPGGAAVSDQIGVATHQPAPPRHVGLEILYRFE
jgi:hypothetical protein